MKFQNMKKTEFQLTISCHQMKFPVQKLCYIQLNCWPKNSHRNPQETQNVVRAIGGSPQTDSKTPLLKKTPIQLTEDREVELVLTQNCNPYILVSFLQYVLCMLLKETYR